MYTEKRMEFDRLSEEYYRKGNVLNYESYWKEEFKKAEDFLKTRIGCKFLVNIHSAYPPDEYCYEKRRIVPKKVSVEEYYEDKLYALVSLQARYGQISKFDESSITFGNKTLIFSEKSSTWKS